MNLNSEELNVICEGVCVFCVEFDVVYWCCIDEQCGFFEVFVKVLIDVGWFLVMILEEYGGFGLGLVEVLVILEEVNCCGGNFGIVYGQMYNMFMLLCNGSEVQKCFYLLKLVSGELCLQLMGVIELIIGIDIIKIKIIVVCKGDCYVINGQKVWILWIQYFDLMILLVCIMLLVEVKCKFEGMLIFFVDLCEVIGKGLIVQLIVNMVNYEINELFFDNLEIFVDSLIGEEGKGFCYIFDGFNVECILIVVECIGDGCWFIDKVSYYVCDCVVFGWLIGQNQGVQFFIVEVYIEVEVVDLMCWCVCQEYDVGFNVGVSVNMVKYLVVKVFWEVVNVCLQIYGGFGFVCEYDVECKFCEICLYQVVLIFINLILFYVVEYLFELLCLF